MSLLYHFLSRRGDFSCNSPSVRDDHGNCIDFIHQKWDLRGPKPLLLIGFIISVLAGCWTFVFVGSETRAKKRAASVASSKTTVEWFKSHSLTGAMVLALIYFIVDAYLRFVQFQQRTLNVASMLLDLARTKPRGSSDYIVLTIILFNNNIHIISGSFNERSLKVGRKIFMVLFTASDLASAIGNIYERVELVVDVASKGASLTYFDVIPPWVATLLSSFDTVSYSLTFLAGIYFITVALKSKVRGRDKARKLYSTYYSITVVAFFIRSIPGVIFCVICEWFHWTRSYSMDLVDNAVYAVTTCVIFFFWSRLAKTPIDVDIDIPQAEIPQTSYDPSYGTEYGPSYGSSYGPAHSQTEYKQPDVAYSRVNPDYH